MARGAGRGGRPPREAASSSALAPAVLRWLRAQGKEISFVVDRAGLDPGDVDRDEVAVTTSGVATILALAADLMAEPHLALRLPAALTYPSYDAGALAARVARAPRDVLAAIVRYAPLVFPRLEARIEGGPNDALRFLARVGGAPRGLGHHVDEYLLMFALTHCRRGGVPVAARRVGLTSARPPGDLGPLYRALGTDEIEFGAEDTGFVLAAEDATAELPAFDVMLVAAVEQLAAGALARSPREGALARTVAAKIEGALALGPVTAESIASGMKMSGRTLQRRLDDEGVRFSLLLDEVRARIAKKLLIETPDSLASIAFRIGFTDLATFSRAFKRWTGVPPGSFRREGTTNRRPSS